MADYENTTFDDNNVKRRFGCPPDLRGHTFTDVDFIDANMCGAAVDPGSFTRVTFISCRCNPRDFAAVRDQITCNGNTDC